MASAFPRSRAARVEEKILRQFAAERTNRPIGDSGARWYTFVRQYAPVAPVLVPRANGALFLRGIIVWGNATFRKVLRAHWTCTCADRARSGVGNTYKISVIRKDARQSHRS